MIQDVQEEQLVQWFRTFRLLLYINLLHFCFNLSFILPYNCCPGNHKKCQEVPKSSIYNWTIYEPGCVALMIMIRTLEGLFNVLLWFFSPTNHFLFAQELCSQYKTRLVNHIFFVVEKNTRHFGTSNCEVKFVIVKIAWVLVILYQGSNTVLHFKTNKNLRINT